MTDATARTETLLELAEALEKREERLADQCNRYAHGICQLSACLKRGGWKRGEPVNHDMATCEVRGDYLLDRAAARALRECDAALEPFADAYDRADRDLSIGDDIAHWRMTGQVLGSYFGEITIGQVRRARAARRTP